MGHPADCDTSISPRHANFALLTAACQEILSILNKASNDVNAEASLIEKVRELCDFLEHTGLEILSVDRSATNVTTAAGDNSSHHQPLLVKTISKLLSSKVVGIAHSAGDLLVALCAAVSTVEDELGKHHSSNNNNNSNNVEWLYETAPKWLALLQNRIENILRDGSMNYFGIPSNNDVIVEGLLSEGEGRWQELLVVSVEAASALIAKCKHKVKTNSLRTLDGLQSLVWVIMGSGNNDEVLNAAATFASVIPMLGQQTQPPAALWSQALFSCLAALTACVHTSWPNKSASYDVDWAMGIGDADEWLARLQSAIDQTKRKASVLHRANALTKLAIALFSMHGYVENSGDMQVQVPLRRCTQACDMLVQFGIGAEAQCVTSSSNSVVRKDIAALNALLSPSSVVSIAISMRSLGHELFASFVQTVGTSLLPYSKDVARLVDAGLFAACSNAVQQQSRGYSIQTSDDNSISLNRVLSVRSKAIHSYKVSQIYLGCGIVPMMSKSLMLVTGSFLEVALLNSQRYDDGGDWASLSEKIEVV